MDARILATLCSGLFAGASLYINLVEHPARMQCGPAIAIAQFRPSYRRGTVMQASLAALGCIAAIVAWWTGAGHWWFTGGILLGAVVPFTLLVILPTNKQLLDIALETTLDGASRCLRKWGRLHAVRSLLSGAAFGIFVILLSR